jgi:hypothetical protein
MSDELSDHLLPYVEKAKSLGVNVEDVMTMHLLIQALRYVDARLKARKAGRSFRQEMEKHAGVDEDTLYMWSKSPYINIASQMIGEAVIEELIERDLRKSIVDVYSRDSLEWFQNMSRIARGIKAPGARMPPLERDQIDAFEALTTTEMGQLFTRMLFLDPEDPDVTPEDLHIARQRALKGKAVKIEAGIIDGEVKEISPKTQEDAPASSG